MAKLKNSPRHPSLPWDLIIIGLIAGAMLVFRFGALPSTDLRSRAATELPSPTGFVMKPLLPAQSVMLPPSVRTATNSRSFGINESISVGVVLNTGALAVSETTVTLTYDPDLLVLSKDAVSLAEKVNATVQVENDTPGEVSVTVFVTEEAGQPALTFNAENPLVYLTFVPKGKAIVGTTITPVLKKSRLAGVRGNAEIPEKIEFRSAEGVQLDLN